VTGLTIADPAFLAAAAGVFSPLSLSPALWLDAADTSTITQSGGKVSAWADKSGNGRDVTQATSTRQPTTGIATQNGRNVISFDGNDWLTSAAFSVPAAGFSTYAVVNVTSTTTRFIWEQSGDTTGRRYLWRNSSNLLIFGYASPTFRDYTTAYAYAGGTRLVMGATSASNVVLRVSPNNEVSTARTGYPVAGSRSVTVGSDALNAFALIGTIAELIIFNSDNDATQRSDVWNYLNAKWAVY
jgi:hypothetical protein